MMSQDVMEKVVDKFHRFCKLFNTVSYNMLDLNKKSKIAAVIIDLAPHFSIPKYKDDFIITYLNEIYQHLANYYVYYTCIYKNPLNKKIFVENDENTYDSINSTALEIEYLLSSVLNVNRALIINLGKYKEHYYLNQFLKKYYYGNSIIFKFINIRHYSNYSKNNWDLNCSSFSSDIDNIKKCIKYLESCGINDRQK